MAAFGLVGAVLCLTAIGLVSAERRADEELGLLLAGTGVALSAMAPGRTAPPRTSVISAPFGR